MRSYSIILTCPGEFFEHRTTGDRQPLEASQHFTAADWDQYDETECDETIGVEVFGPEHGMYDVGDVQTPCDCLDRGFTSMDTVGEKAIAELEMNPVDY